MPLLDIFTARSHRLNSLFASLFSMKVYVGVKDSRGCYIAANQSLVDSLAFNSPNDLIGMTDFDFVWREFAAKYMRDDQQVQKTEKSNFFIEPICTSKNEIFDFLTVKAPLMQFVDSYSGVIYVSIPLN